MLKGTLDDFTLPDVFRLLSYAKKTGRLDINRSAGEGEVFFREGEVYYAQSSLSRDPLGQRLIRAGGLTEGQLRKALDENAATGRRVGEILVDSGVVSPEQIEVAVRNQIEDAAFDLLRWELGEFSWEPEVAADVEIRLAVSVENLIIEASRRLDELEVIKRKIPSAESVLRMAPKPPEGAVEINITPDEWRVLVLVDGTRTVAEIGELGGMDEFQAMRAFYGLVSAGLVEVKSGAGETAETPAAEALKENLAEKVAEPVASVETEEPVEEPAEPPGEGEALEEVAPQPAEATAQGAEDEAEEQEPAVAEEEAEDEGLVAETEGAEPVPEPVSESPEEPGAELEAEAPEEAWESELEPAASAEQEALSSPDTETDVAGEEERFSPAAGLDATSEFLVSSGAGSAPDELLEEPEVAVDQFDAPAPDEVSTETPGEGEKDDQDAFLAELFADEADAVEPSARAGGEMIAAGEETTESLEGPAEVVEEEAVAPAAASSTEAPQPPGAAPKKVEVDRAAVVRELAGLFSEEEAVPRPRSAPSGRTRRPAAAASRGQGGQEREKGRSGEEPEDDRKRVEDDDQINKGLISRLIDGVKGL